LTRAIIRIEEDIAAIDKSALVTSEGDSRPYLLGFLDVGDNHPIFIKITRGEIALYAIWTSPISILRGHFPLFLNCGMLREGY